MERNDFEFAECIELHVSAALAQQLECVHAWLAR